MAIRIGPARIADAHGTHEPGSVVESPTEALLELATNKVLDPESGKPLCAVISAAQAAATLAAMTAPEPLPEPVFVTTDAPPAADADPPKPTPPAAKTPAPEKT
jgi:hypothetical protein